MFRSRFATSALALLLASLATTTLVSAQEAETRDEFSPSAEDGDWNYQKIDDYRPDPRAIIHQKAQWRAQQRMTRLAAMNWYGMYNARPTAAPTPFTSLYSPVWQMPGGRPYGWSNRGTTVIVTQPETRTYTVTR